MEDVHDYYEEYDRLFTEILQQMVNKSNDKIRLRKINPNMYQKALNEFIKFGKLVHYPTKYVQDWKNIVITNYLYLDVITMFFGHTQHFDVDTFNDMVFGDENTDNHVSDWTEASKYITKMGYDDVLDNFLPQFSNGADLISDAGLKPLGEIVVELIEENDPNKILVLINKALDVSHQRSDLSELFIEGGEGSLDRISGMNESIRKIVKEEIVIFLNKGIS